ncbi:MAG TPA: AtpZ/AtpI family protein [Thermoanaerobaculia bacterium]|jgi:F0F1-type ATP synthase assembly protein I
MPVDREERRRKRRSFRHVAEASSLGLMFPIAIALGYFWGRWMDRVFGTAPWLMYVFTACGLVAAFVNLFRIGMKDDG